MTIIESVRPGISLIFEREGFKVSVTQEGAQIKVELVKGEVTEARYFPFPRANKDLSIELLRWRDELKGQA